MSNISNITNTTPDYLSYLLRLWRAPGTGGHVWRASLEEPLTQEVFRFEDLQSLFVFMLAQIGQDEQEGDVAG